MKSINSLQAAMPRCHVLGFVYQFIYSNCLCITKSGFSQSRWCTSTRSSEAIDAVGPGFIIKICPGTYPEQLSISEQLTLQGEERKSGRCRDYFAIDRVSPKHD